MRQTAGFQLSRWKPRSKRFRFTDNLCYKPYALLCFAMPKAQPPGEETGKENDQADGEEGHDGGLAIVDATLDQQQVLLDHYKQLTTMAHMRLA